MSNSSRPLPMRASLALSCVGPMLMTLTPAYAQPAEPQDKVLGGVTVSSTAIAEEGRHQETPKATRPVRDMPQTITVIPREAIQQQNLLSLQEVLSTVPGITFGAGEGGSGYGDKITLRGYSADSDITVDGVRDSAQYTRSDTFDIDQVEVVNGANSVYSGSGSVGGTINLVSKRPLARNSATITAGIGTADYYRATADVNRRLSDNVALRLNVMGHLNDIPGRDVENNKRWGVAPAISFGMNSPTKLTLMYFHQSDRNIPQFGVPYFSNAYLVGPLPGVSTRNYYGFRNVDTQRIETDQATAILDHEFSDRLSLRNLFRYEEVGQFSRADGPEGTFCQVGGLTGTGVACTAGTQVPGYFTASGGSRGNTRDTHNRMVYNQTDLKGTIKTLGIEHTLDLGLSLSRENFDASTGNSIRNADGTTPVIPLYNIANPNQVVPGATAVAAGYGSNVWNGPVNFIPTAQPHGRLRNAAVYLFDAAKLGDHFEINGGVRWEHSNARFRSDTVSAVAPTLGQVTRGATFSNSVSLFSYRVGLVYKPVEAISLYAAYGNSRTPSQSSVNGGCSAATCNVKPETAKNYEVGAKAELLDGALLLTASVFRNDRDSYKVASNDPTLPDQQLDGRSRVEGILLGAQGHITKAWQVIANYSYLKSKLLQSVSDFCLKNPGATGCANNAAFPDPAKGAAIQQVPRHSGSLYTSYRLPFGLTLGYGATYQGRFAFNLPTITAQAIYYSKDYLIHNAMVLYEITPRISAQVNVKNFTNKGYFTRIRSAGGSGWATPGDARSAMLTLSYHM